MERKGLCCSAFLELLILIDWLHPFWAWESAGESICLCHSQETNKEEGADISLSLLTALLFFTQ